MFPQVAKSHIDHGPSQVAWLQYNGNGMNEKVTDQAS